MPTAVLEQAFLTDAPRKRWTRAECAVVEAAGAWDQQHLELVNGELISKMGKKRPHTVTTTLVHKWLSRVSGPDYVNIETPNDVATKDNPINEPEPVEAYSEQESVQPLAAPAHSFLVNSAFPR